jgi:hypothetical protein
MLKIEIEEYGEKEDIIGSYNYKIYYDEKLIRQGKFGNVLKIRELEAIISCFSKEICGNMFKKD